MAQFAEYDQTLCGEAVTKQTVRILTSAKDVDEPDLLKVDFVYLPVVIRRPTGHLRVAVEEGVVGEVFLIGIIHRYELPAEDNACTAGILRVQGVDVAMTEELSGAQTEGHVRVLGDVFHGCVHIGVIEVEDASGVVRRSICKALRLTPCLSFQVDAGGRKSSVLIRVGQPARCFRLLPERRLGNGPSTDQHHQNTHRVHDKPHHLP
jgi:hypothetical protein